MDPTGKCSSEGTDPDVPCEGDDGPEIVVTGVKPEKAERPTKREIAESILDNPQRGEPGESGARAAAGLIILTSDVSQAQAAGAGSVMSAVAVAIGGEKLTTPTSPGSKKRFTRLKGGQGFKDNETSNIWQRSTSNHGGTQWKIKHPKTNKVLASVFTDGKLRIRNNPRRGGGRRKKK